ncbi:hypothetical protein ACFL09_06545 [Planctomycetota bacterium]
MRRRLFILCVVGFWVVMMGTLVRRYLLEVRPEYVPGTWQSVLTRERRNYQWRKGIYLPTTKGLQRVGHTQTVFYYRGDRKYSIQNHTKATVAVPGILPKPTAFELMATALVTSDFSLERLTMRLDSEPVKAICHGHVENGKLILRATVNDQEQEPFEIDLPSGQVAAQGFSPMLALPRLEEGMKWEVVVVDPFTFRPSRVEMEVRRREKIEWQGTKVDTYVVAIRSGILGAVAWVTPEGEVLKEQTLFGLTFIKEPLPEESEGGD